MNLRKTTVIECIASTPSADVTGETLNLEGADISPLLEGRGFVNSDHSAKFEHLVGRVTDARKIFKAEDCQTPSQRKFFEETGRKPYLWTKCELWDGVGHKEADAIASIYKHYQAKAEDAPIQVSVEGKTLERGTKGELKRTLIRGVALTVHPCNRETRTSVVEITKSLGADSLIKAEGFMAPSFIESNENPLERLYQLAVVARQLLTNAANTVQKSEIEEAHPVLKSREMLERLKQMIAAKKAQ